MNNKQWKLQEHVVAVIETFLDETATVGRDVNLPVLSSQSGTVRQCDVVIYQGTPPRQTVSIVEVQKRGKKVEINDFGGWLEKKESVGAQHLICVSEKGFPRSVIEKAKLYGPGVRLLTLTNLEREGWPIPTTPRVDVLEFLEITGQQIEGYHLIKVFDIKEGDIRNQKPTDVKFRLPQQDKVVTGQAVLDWFFFVHRGELDKIPGDGSVTHVQVNISCSEKSKALSTRQVGGEWVPIRNLIIIVRMSRTAIQLDWQMSEYFQLDWNDGIAWVLRGEALHKGVQFSVVAPIKRLRNGRYQQGRPQLISDTQLLQELSKSFEMPGT